MIILEGPDGAGKSSLARVLSHEFKLKVFHPGGAPDVYKFKEFAHECKARLLKNYVCDRVSQISEYVYGPITNNRVIMQQRDVEEFFDWCYDNATTIVFCKPSNIKDASGGLKAKDHKPEAFLKLVKENRDVIVKAYDKMFSLPAANRLRKDFLLLEYDYTSIKSEHKLLRAIHNKLRLRNRV